MILIKWGKKVHGPNQPAFLYNKVIGKLYGIDGSSVQRLYTKRFQELAQYQVLTRKKRKQQEDMPIRQRYGYRFLKQEHIDYLRNPDTLALWVGKSLDERCVMFHRHFGNHRINQTLLRQFYQKHKIKRKRIKLTKQIKPDRENESEQWRLAVKERVSDLKGAGYRIIYLDECFITSKTMMTMSYSPYKTSHRIPMSSVDQPTYSLILAISKENGLEHYDVYKKGFNEVMFADYLDKLYIANKHGSIAVFMDNVSSHKTFNIKMKMREL